ncbi:MAG: tripartite tricarboxylate transporter substrate binding protein [Proteobacteria bacterium]|nr:tripartite tricarboxylate transporter substrate binding protein [Pseudomonadota bacterium]
MSALQLTYAIAGTCVALLATGHADAATTDFPSHPLRMIVPYSPSGNADIMARLVAQRLSDNLHQQVVVDNRPGANGIIGTGLAVKAAPDGYTIVLVASSLATNPSLVKSMPYDTQRDLAAISMVGSTPLIIAAFAGLPVVTIKDLIALAKTKPGLINYASSGHGSPANMAGELFKFMTGTNIVHVAYKGTAQATTDVLGGHVQIFYPSMTVVLPYVRSGKLKALGMTSLTRSPLAPEVPTVSESGVPGYQANIWNGILAPAATPKALIAKLNAEIVRALSAPELRDRFAAAGADAAHSTPEEFRAFIAAEQIKWAKVIRDAGIRVDLER